jgi:hypothetical protein
MNWLFGGLSREIASLTGAIRGLAMSHRRPVFWVRLSLKEPNSMALVYSVSAGAPVDADVTSRELTVVVNGEKIGEPVSFDGSAVELGEIKVSQNASVLITLVDVDDAGNRSQPATFEFTATDTIAPAQPGSFGVALVREE